MHDNSNLRLLHLLCRLPSWSREADNVDVELARVDVELAKVDDWQRLLGELELNGIAPLALEQVQRFGLNVPKEELLQLNALQFRHSLIAEARYKVLGKIKHAFDEAGIPFIALKGTALSQLIYAGSEARPMRDMDILVPEHLLEASANVLRAIGFHIPEQQKSQFMNGVHQLPDATMSVDGFTVCVEIHHNTMPRDVFDSLTFADAVGHTQTFYWKDLKLQALGHSLMLHHLCRHLQTEHPEDTIKLVNVVDIVTYVEKFHAEIDWHELTLSYPHVINTLKCLHFIVPIPSSVGEDEVARPVRRPSGVGECMPALSRLFLKSRPFLQGMKLLISPPRWWLHLHYGIDPDRPLYAVLLFRHPWRTLKMLNLRLISWCKNI